MLKVNLHACHTNYSHDGYITLEEVIKNAKKRKTKIQITDHNSLYQFLRLKGEDAKNILPPSVEFTLSEGIDFIACGENLLDLPKNDKRFPLLRKKALRSLDVPLEEAIETAKEYSECLIAPHPAYHGIMSHRNYQDLLPNFHVIEIFNFTLSLVLPWKNKEAYNLAKKYDMPVSYGNDAHFTSSLGACYNLIGADSRTEVYDAIKKGKICPKFKLSYFPRSLVEIEKFALGHLMHIFNGEDTHPPNLSSLLTKQLY